METPTALVNLPVTGVALTGFSAPMPAAARSRALPRTLAPLTYRYQDPRQFILTNTFSF